MLFFWDASALAKRYFVEEGSTTVNALFAQVPRRNMASTPWGYIETYSILLRRHNGSVLSAADFAEATRFLEAEVFDDVNFTLLSIPDDFLFASLAVMRRHNLNSTDAAIIAMPANPALACAARFCAGCRRQAPVTRRAGRGHEDA